MGKSENGLRCEPKKGEDDLEEEKVEFEGKEEEDFYLIFLVHCVEHEEA
jgi:hypothetical protein